MARIIVIDDDKDVRKVILYELRAAGHEVREAGDGAQGLALQRAAPADLVVTDIYMPEKEGIETIRDLRQEFPATHVIAMSGGSRVGPASEGLAVVAGELGVAAVLYKPFHAKELLACVDSALGAQPGSGAPKA